MRILARFQSGCADIKYSDPSIPDDGGHFNVLMFALGAACGDGSRGAVARSFHAGFEMGVFSTRDYLFA